jgi:DNA-binding CsgD family transcriptional regulator
MTETERFKLLADLALQNDLLGYERVLRPLMDGFELAAWACLFPAAFSAGDQPLLISKGIRMDSPLLHQAMHHGMRAALGKPDNWQDAMQALATEIAPADGGPRQFLRIVRNRQTALTLFLFRPPLPFGRGFERAELEAIVTAGHYIERCYQRLAAQVEGEFMQNFLRLVGGLHPEGLCLLDSRQRVVFDNRQFREHMLLWQSGDDQTTRQFNLPRQVSLPPIWQRACQERFQETAASVIPPENMNMAITQGPLVKLQASLSDGRSLEGALRVLCFRSPLGVRHYQLITSNVQRETSVRPAETSETLEVLAKNHQFSRREMDVARLLLKGYSAGQITEKLNISEPTVKSHTQSLFRKTQVHSRLQFVALCKR